MPINADSLNEAVQQGYSPDDILDHIQKKYPEYQAKFAEARKEGYSASEVIEHLRQKSSPAPQGTQAPPVPQAAASVAPTTSVEGQSTPDVSIPAQRAQMGLPTRTSSGNRIETIRPNEQVLANTQIQEGNSVPHPQIFGKGQSLLNRGLGIAGLTTGLPYLAEAAEKAGKSGKLMTPGLAGGLFSSLPGGMQAAAIGKIPGVAAAGRALGPLAAKAMPTFTSAAEKLTSRLTSWANDVPPLAHAVMGRLMQHEADTHAAYMEVDQLGKELGKSGMTDGQLSKIYDAYVHEGKGIDSLSDTEKAFLDKIVPIKKSLTDLAMKEGVISESKDWYFTQLYKKGAAKAFLRPVQKNSPVSMARTYNNPTELAEAQNKIITELEAKGITKADAMGMKDSELRLAGFNPNIKHTLDLEPYKDPIKAVQAQLIGVRTQIATKRNVLSLADMQNEYGQKLIDNVYGPGRVKLDSSIFNKWAAYSSKKGDKTLTKFVDKDAWVLKEHAQNVNNLLSIKGDYPTWMREMRELNRATKLMRFFNPGVHNINETMGALQAFNGNIFKALGIPGKAIAKDPNKLAEAVRDGYQTQRAYELKQGIAKDFGVVMDKYKSKVPYLTDTMDGIQQKVTNPMLWNHVDHIGLTIWDATKQKLISQGLSEKDAGQAAATFAHDVIGKMNSYTTMAMFKNPYVNTLFNFIPSWINSSVRKYVGAIAPAQAFQHLSEPARKALQVEYQHNLIHGAVLGNLITQRLNFALSGKSTFENQQANRPSFAHPFGRVEMNMGGKLYAVDAPVMGSLTLPPRILSAIYNVAKGNPQAAMGYVQPTMTAPTAYMQGAKQGGPMAGLKAAGQQLSPLGQFYDPKKPMGETLLNTVLPVRLQQADPRSDVTVKLWTLYKNDNKFQIIGQQEPWKNDVDKALQNKDLKKAGQLAAMHMPGPTASKFLEHRILKIEKPNTYTFMMIPKNQREKYLSQLSPQEVQTLQDKIRMEASSSASTP